MEIKNVNSNPSEIIYFDEDLDLQPKHVEHVC